MSKSKWQKESEVRMHNINYDRKKITDKEREAFQFGLSIGFRMANSEQKLHVLLQKMFAETKDKPKFSLFLESSFGPASIWETES